MIRIELLAREKRTVRAPTDPSNDLTEVLANNHLANVLMGQSVLLEKVVIEEVAEGPVTDVMQEGRDAEELFHVGLRGDIGEDLGQGRVEMAREAARDMHDAERVLEPAVLSGGVHPASTLQLVDVPETLNPGRVNQVFLCALRRVRRRKRNGKGDVLVNRVGDQRGPVVWRAFW